MKPLLLIALCLSAATAGYAQNNDNDNNTSQNSNDRNYKCISVPIALSGDTKEVTVTPSTTSGTDNIFIYCHERKARHRKFNHDEFNDLTVTDASKPLLLHRKDALKILPQTYKVTVNSPENTVTACQDSTLNLTASINVEQQSEFSGNYPTNTITRKNNYVLVSRKQYRKAERKLAHLEKKEKKVARATGVAPRGV